MSAHNLALAGRENTIEPPASTVESESWGASALASDQALGESEEEEDKK